MLKRLALLLAAPLALSTAPVAAHDAPLALLEAVDQHQQECRFIDNYRPQGTPKSQDWSLVEGNDPLIEAQIAKWRANADTGFTKAYTRSSGDLTILQVVGTFITSAGHKRNVCMTTLGGLAFMPTTRTLSAFYGADVAQANTNNPGDFRDGWWIWDGEFAAHKGSFARYTNSYFGVRDPAKLPADVIYPGFYIVSEFTDMEALVDEASRSGSQPDQANNQKGEP